ncbi:hatching enzyme 1.2-like [Montipora capricornis]|uniref:hatching enzyme 1.2-like n=1 Tax=Montipora capricornis TaxID=246305 RepID=UPI0035F2170C
MRSSVFSQFFSVLVIVILMEFFSKVISAPWLNKRHSNEQIEIIEGDVLVTDNLRDARKAGKSRDKRDIVSDMVKRWPDGVVPFTIDSSIGKEALSAIKKAMHEFHKRTCVKFVPRTDEPDFIEFEGNLGCFSAIGRQGGKQRISVGEGCEYKGTVMHELMHVLGFFHEQSRTDRDDYIMVLWWNIEPGFEKNFDSYGPDRLDSAQEPYDFDSLMHYDKQAFSKNGDNTLQSIADPNRPLGNMDDFSAIDIKQLLKDYPCKPWDKKPALHAANKSENSEKRKCRDKFEKECQRFASHTGYCDHWKKFMTKWCPHSCGFCKPDAPDKRINIWRGEKHMK